MASGKLAALRLMRKFAVLDFRRHLDGVHGRHANRPAVGVAVQIDVGGNFADAGGDLIFPCGIWRPASEVGKCKPAVVKKIARDQNPLLIHVG